MLAYRPQLLLALFLDIVANRGEVAVGGRLCGLKEGHSGRLGSPTVPAGEPFEA